MTIKKIKVINEKENKKEKQKIEFSREKLLELSRKKTFKQSILPNISSIKNEVKQFKEQRNNWKIEKANSQPKKTEIKIAKPIQIKSKLSKIKNRNPNPLNKSIKNKIKPVIRKRKNTKKLNEIEILVLMEHLSDLLYRNRIDKLSSVLNKVKRKQLIQVLHYYNVFKHDTQAPTPLLKNIIFNLLFDDIVIR
jgi:hypothetical protein